MQISHLYNREILYKRFLLLFCRIEVTQGTHLEAIMKSVEWQQKMLRGNLRITRLKDKDTNERRNKKLPGHRAKYAARLKKSSSSILTASM